MAALVVSDGLLEKDIAWPCNSFRVNRLQVLGVLVYRFLYSAYNLSGIAWAPDSTASHVTPNGCANLISLKTPGSSCCSRILPALGSGVRQKLGVLLSVYVTGVTNVLILHFEK